MFDPERVRPERPEQSPQLRLVAPAPSVSMHWRSLADAANEAAFSSAWLALQCGRIAGATAGLLVLRQQENGAPRTSATWGIQNRGDQDALAKVAQRVLSEGRTVVVAERAAYEADGAARGQAGCLLGVPVGTGG